MISKRKPTAVVLRNAGSLTNFQQIVLVLFQALFIFNLLLSTLELQFLDPLAYLITYLPSLLYLVISPDPVVLQMLLKHHPAVSDLTVAVQIKDLKKTLRTICLFKHLRQLGLHVKGGSQVVRLFADFNISKRTFLGFVFCTYL